MEKLGRRSDKLKQPKLIDYGIQCERSHLRAHVCPLAKRVYVYPTGCGVNALSRGREAYGYQDGVEGATANGRLVKPFDIERMVCLKVNVKSWDALKFSDKDTTSEKGRKAVRLVKGMLKAGIFPLPTACIVDGDVSKAIQIKGDDIYVWTVKGRVRIQVKCDFPGGEKELGGTGFLYLQTAERNPLKRL